MLSNHTISNNKYLLKLDTHDVFEYQTSMQSFKLLLREFVFAMSEVMIPWNKIHHHILVPTTGSNLFCCISYYNMLILIFNPKQP